MLVGDAVLVGWCQTWLFCGKEAEELVMSSLSLCVLDFPPVLYYVAQPLLGAGGDLYLLLRIRELCQICLFFNSLSLASMSASFSVPNPPAHLLLDS